MVIVVGLEDRHSRCRTPCVTVISCALPARTADQLWMGTVLGWQFALWIGTHTAVGFIPEMETRAWRVLQVVAALGSC